MELDHIRTYPLGFGYGALGYHMKQRSLWVDLPSIQETSETSKRSNAKTSSSKKRQWL
jgi:hypothetical protein